MATWKDATPEQRREWQKKAAKTRAAKKAAAEQSADETILQETVVEAVAEIFDDERAERRRRLTSDLPSEIADLITDEQLEKIEIEARERARAARLKDALEDIKALAKVEAEIEQGMIAADVLRTEEEKARLNAKVKVRCNLPAGGGALGLRIDGRLFRHGEIATVTVAQAESMHYTTYRAWLSELQFRTLDQHKAGNSANEVLAHNPPQFYVSR